MSNWFSRQRLASLPVASRLRQQVDPLGLAGALMAVGARTAGGALPRRMAGLGIELGKITVGRSSIAADPKDRRFQNRAWSENPAYRRLCQSYLAWSRSALELVDDAHLDWRTEARAKLAATLVTSALAPCNAALLNPDAIERAYETGGRSLVTGLENFSRDLLTNRGFPRMADPDAFVVGRDLAVTPGAVVYRDEVCELLQYSPATDTVQSTPLVMVPPQINKYYFMDLAPGRSFVEFCVAKGFQMFAISWRNPTKEHRDWDLDTYVDAANEAVHAACEIAGTDQANTVALCAGGLTTAALLSRLASIQENVVNCATFAVTLLDFSVPTMIGLFSTADIVQSSLRSSNRSGVAGGSSATALFSLLRPNDLIWNYWVSNNLVGEEQPTFDILAWNCDATRLPAALHADFLDIFLQNSLVTGTFAVHGTPVDLSKIECDSFVVGALSDHLTPWKACYATTQLLGGASQFALSSSGHIQSLVNPPGNPKMSVATAPAAEADPDRWLAQAESVTGSWWEPWAVWLAARSGGHHRAPAEMGSVLHPAGDAAPGRYVLAP